MRTRQISATLLCLGMTVAAFASTEGSEGSPAPLSDALTARVVVPASVNAATRNNISSRAQVNVDADSRNLIISDLALGNYGPVTAVDVRSGKDYSEALAHEGFKADADKPVTWHLLVDISGTNEQRNKVIKAELHFIMDILDMIPDGDKVELHALGAGTRLWGKADSRHERAQLRESVESRIKSSNFGDSDFRLNTFIYSSLEHIINSTADAGGNRTIVLLSDGNDETGIADQSNADLRTEARDRVISKALEADIHIHTLGFAQDIPDRGGFPLLDALSSRTGGVHQGASLRLFKLDNKRQILNRLKTHAHPHSGSITINLPEAIDNNVCVTLRGEGLETGSITVSREYILDNLPPLPDTSTTEYQAFSSLLARLDTLQARLNDIRRQKAQLCALMQDEAQDSSAAREQLSRLMESSGEQLSEATRAANELRAMSPTELRKASADILADSRRSDTHKTWTAALQQQCDTPGTGPSDATMLAILGHDCSLLTLPERMVENKEQMPAQAADNPGFTDMELIILASIIGVLLLMVLVSVMRRRKDLVVIDPHPGGTPTGVGKVYPVLGELTDLASHHSWKISKPTVTIGRDERNDIVITNTSVSSSHCVLKRNRNGHWILTDLGSANGIYYNNSIIGTLTLQDGTEFELGDVRLRFHIHNAN